MPPTRAPSAAALLARLEVPACRCPRRPLPCACEQARASGRCDCPVRLPPPCSHVLAVTHGLDLAEWAELQQALCPEEFQEPPAPAAPAAVHGRAARVALYANRATAGVGLWHPGDDLREDADARDTLQRLADLAPADTRDTTPPEAA